MFELCFLNHTVVVSLLEYQIKRVIFQSWYIFSYRNRKRNNRLLWILLFTIDFKSYYSLDRMQCDRFVQGQLAVGRSLNNAFCRSS